ncbi:unnamed protein product [Ranitomeya imitator]|uniref:Uncharacterized protein n=1 Tax=Ranitomeya imitator TaxID=111125 RepID=A0ABN9LVK6_9NEOB|nr:unnamed protein product [Ranitomeya imitator]
MLARESIRSNQSVWFGHYPTSTIVSPSPGVRAVMSPAVAYMCGHLHTLGGLAPVLHSQHLQGTLELELGDWMHNRRFRIFAFDHDLFSFVDLQHEEWPAILITNPKSALYSNPSAEPLERILHSTHIRYRHTLQRYRQRSGSLQRRCLVAGELSHRQLSSDQRCRSLELSLYLQILGTKRTQARDRPTQAIRKPQVLETDEYEAEGLTEGDGQGGEIQGAGAHSSSQSGAQRRVPQSTSHSRRNDNRGGRRRASQRAPEQDDEEEGIDVNTLIEAVQSREPLWNMSDRRHADQLITRRLWEEVCSAVMDNWEELDAGAQDLAPLSAALGSLHQSCTPLERSLKSPPPGTTSTPLFLHLPFRLIPQPHPPALEQQGGLRHLKLQVMS